ncbi:hypothetical protein DL98DRAFT_32094 [Cadophora sp. DSE1049]|nr:hypothetical protein DL98DRAFT_32094 [Cadophora sp. DSE1049]
MYMYANILVEVWLLMINASQFWFIHRGGWDFRLISCITTNTSSSVDISYCTKMSETVIRESMLFRA